MATVGKDKLAFNSIDASGSWSNQRNHFFQKLQFNIEMIYNFWEILKKLFFIKLQKNS